MFAYQPLSFQYDFHCFWPFSVVVNYFKPWALMHICMTNGLFHPHQMDVSISKFRGVWHFFYFNFIFFRISCKQCRPLIRRCVLRRLIWVCTVCLGPKKGKLGLYGLSSIVNIHHWGLFFFSFWIPPTWILAIFKKKKKLFLSFPPHTSPAPLQCAFLSI